MSPTPRTRQSCGSGFWGGQRPSLAHYVTGMGPMDGATAAGGRSCCLSSTLRHGDGTHGRSDRCRRSFVLPILHIMSRGWDPWTERPLPEVVRVAYPPAIVDVYKIETDDSVSHQNLVTD